MKFPEACEYMDKVNKSVNLKAEVIRILPEDVDSIEDGDDGWDVEISSDEGGD